MLFLLILSLLGELFSSECQATGTYTTDTHFVVPSSTFTKYCVNNNLSQGSPCKTIDEYAVNNTLENNMTMVFLPGIHNLTKNFTVKDEFKFDIIMTGYNLLANETQVVLYQGGIVIQTSVKISLSHLSILSFSSHVVLIKNVSDVAIEDVVITGSAIIIQCINCNVVNIMNVVFIGSVLVIAWPEYYLHTHMHFAYNSVIIKDSVFHLAPVGNGISCCNVGSLLIESVSINNLPQASVFTPPESSLVTYCYHFPWGLTEREVCDLITTGINIVSIHNSALKRTSSTGLCIHVALNAKVLLNKTIVSDHTKGGAMFTYGDNGVNLIILNSTISNNSNAFSGSTMASALSVYTVNVENALPHLIPKLNIISSHFIGNAHLVSRPTSTVCITSHVKATIQDSDFIDNYGSAITAYTTYVDHVLVIFYGTIVFHNNTSHRGGAIHLFKSRIGLTKGVNMLLEHNFAKDVGGAIYVHSTKWLSNYYDTEDGNYGDCFFVLIDCNSQNFKDYFTMQFNNNSAKNGGEHIFGASLLSDCNVCPLNGLSSSVLHPLFSFHQPGMLSFSPISSYPSRVCVCEYSDFYISHFFCLNTSLMFLSRSVYPGETFTLDVVLVGAEFGTGTGVVYAQFLSPSSFHLHPRHQYLQRVNDFKQCTQLNYTVYSYSPLAHEVLVLTASDKTVVEYGDKQMLSKESDMYNQQRLLSVAPPAGLLITPVYINLTLLPCPHGFQLMGNPSGCKCIPALIKYGIFCNFTEGIGYVYRNDTIWVNAIYNDSIVMQKRCPFNYCLTHLIGVDLRYPDTQCAMNHAGTLCGGCKKGFSLALGTNMCLPCENNSSLGLIVLFTLAGILLVVFIKILNMTVSQGTINGLVFYANIVWGYQDVLFPKTLNKWFMLMKIFIAWLNLDFGIETCFALGLTAYAKTWLQFVFPLYIWSIAGLIILLARNSKVMTKIFGNNCVQVLATLFLLSFTKLLRTTITIMVPAVLYIYSKERNEIKLVWALDGNLSYCGYLHGFLFVTALATLLALWLPFTTFLLFFKMIMKGSSHKYLRWINRLIPFTETYFGPLNIANYYWVGLLLLVRGTLLVILTSTYTTTPLVSIFSLVLTITLLLALLAYTGRVYKNKLLSALECSFLVNLQVLGVSILFIDLEIGYAGREVAVIVSLTIAFIQFIGIICIHVYQTLIKKLIKQCHQARHLTTYDTETNSQYQLMEGESTNDVQERSCSPTIF